VQETATACTYVTALSPYSKLKNRNLQKVAAFGVN
jgi:hypothetical protein